MLEAFKPTLLRLLHVRPLLSIVVVGYRMQRELPRTLETLSASYQRDVSGAVYEVIVADNGSEPAMDSSMLECCRGVTSRWLRLPPGKCSMPGQTWVFVMRVVILSRLWSMVRMLSPGIVVNILAPDVCSPMLLSLL